MQLSTAAAAAALHAGPVHDVYLLQLPVRSLLLHYPGVKLPQIALSCISCYGHFSGSKLCLCAAQ